MHAPRKQAILITPVSVATTATATGSVDTLGFDYLEIDLVMGTVDSTTNAPSVMKLAHSDDATNYTDISGAVGGTDFTTAGSISVANGYKFGVDLRGKKRYVKLSVTPLTTQLTAAVANLSRGEAAPVSATKAGVQNLVVI